jgi:hypothetical protein
MIRIYGLEEINQVAEDSEAGSVLNQCSAGMTTPHTPVASSKRGATVVRNRSVQHCRTERLFGILQRIILAVAVLTV